MPKRSRRPTSRSSPSSSYSDIDGSALVESLLGGWRALARLDVDGFALLRSRGVTRRANSIVPIDPPAEPAALAAAVERLEGLAEAAGQTPTFRLFTAPRLEHGPLWELLLARGYVPEGHTLVQQRELPAAGTAPHPGARILVGAPDEDWLAASWRLSPRPEEGARETTRDLMAGTPAVYVSLPSADGAADAAVGRAALVTQGRRTVAVLDAIAVDPAHRRHGLGRAVVGSLLALAAVQGAGHALLEVEERNAAARALYRGACFHAGGEYHYLRRA
ncbi:N-acetyltransferase [Brachybacterium sp. SGAir0954]|uniref:GNAT family N-acetyltransferase n=1 Tax=Brachybacterium sp. SGAir0954 TaxID=2571029 RepID=UPI00143DDC9F|nr:GNAT family N-acetyltransferase [Brachybacterium sp. SGAir0954]